MSYPLGTGPQPPTPRPERRTLWTAAATVVLLAGLATAAAANGLRSDDPKESASTDTTDGTESTTSSAEGDDSTTTGIDLGDATLGDLGLGSDEPPNDPLPGEGWNSEAQTQFIDECADDSAWTDLSIDGNTMCTCVWEDLTTSGIATFDELNEEWQADEADTSTPGGQAMSHAVNGCVVAQLPGLG